MAATTRKPIISVGGLIPCCAFLCCINSLTFKAPEYCGLYQKNVCFCLQYENFCCKRTDEPGYDCIYCRQECMQVESCQTCCQVENQCCCIDFRCTDHKNDEQPCICTILFFTCYFKDQRACYCCGNVDSLEAQVQANSPSQNTPGPATPQSMHRPNAPTITAAAARTPAPGSYSPTFIGHDERYILQGDVSAQSSGRGSYTPVASPHSPPVFATSVASAPSYVPEASVVYA